MKTTIKINIWVLIFLSSLIISCKKSFIELAPQDSPSSATFFKTEEQFRQALIAAYNALRGLMNVDFYTAEMRSDNTHYENYAVNRGDGYVHRENIADFLDHPTNSYIANLYYACYTGIARANVVIDHLEGATLDESAKRDIDGQAKFLRAFFYFKLVRYFGDVPLSLHEVTKADDAFLPRTPAAEVYQQIISDATAAIDQLEPPTTFPQNGLASKGAATMLLAEVYMTQHQYPEAETLLRNLTTMGYELLPDYASVFSTSNKNSKESIFEVQYQQGVTDGQQSNFIYRFLPRSTNTAIITGVQTNNVGDGGYNNPTQDMIAAYEPGDKRLDASIGIAEGVYDASMLFTFSANKSVVGYQAPTGKIGIPYIKKMLHPHSSANNTDDNWPIYRYADALLLLAEALNEQGNVQEALTYINQVRVPRTGLDALTATGPDALRELIAHERRVELAFENHRWHDLVRTGKAIEVMTTFGAKLKQQLNYLPTDAFHVVDYRMLYPIPQAERDLNPALTQNPGYTN
ncbi:RagB/SusD family nutrient uptake outer membrane protein [Olivibacter ginsenosidimutans]|uniref:RagB/SusD family nutrient uptake outer membrane protein n=1 Tax=Olivibacter ginsenosidimutans TaxID=1176537 RepID=A0ABP9AFH4_9SPHI